MPSCSSLQVTFHHKTDQQKQFQETCKWEEGTHIAQLKNVLQTQVIVFIFVFINKLIFEEQAQCAKKKHNLMRAGKN